MNDFLAAGRQVILSVLLCFKTAQLWQNRVIKNFGQVDLGQWLRVQNHEI